MINNIVDLLPLQKKKEMERREEYKKSAPFAETTAELVCEFLNYCIDKPDTLEGFCDIVTAKLRMEASDTLLSMVAQIKKSLLMKNRRRNRMKPATVVKLKKE